MRLPRLASSPIAAGQNRACQIAGGLEPMADMRFEFENQKAAVARAGWVQNPRFRLLGPGARRFHAFVPVLVMAVLLTIRGATGAGSVAGGHRRVHWDHQLLQLCKEPGSPDQRNHIHLTRNHGPD